MADSDISNQEMQEKQTENDAMNTSFEGSRMRTLRDVMNKTIKSYTNNLKLLQPLSNVSTSILKCLQKETMTQLESNIKCELEQMYTEENIECLLNTLDKMSEMKPPTEVAVSWRPSGNVQKDIRPQVAVLKREKLKVIENTLCDLEAQNKLLVDKVKKRENTLLHTRDKIQRTLGDLEQMVSRESDIQTEVVQDIQNVLQEPS